MNKICADYYELCCQPDGMIGSKIRYMLRKGIPGTLGIGVGAGINYGLNSFIHTLENTPQLTALELTGFIGIFSASLAYTLIDYGFEQFWYTNYQDNFREYTDTDYEQALDQLEESAAIQNQTVQTYNSL